MDQNKKREKLRRIYNNNLFFILIVFVEIIFLGLVIYQLIKNPLLATSWIFFIFSISQLVIIYFLLRDFWSGIHYSEKILGSKIKEQLNFFDNKSYSGLVIKDLYENVMRDTNTETLTVKAKLFALQNQINPHFLYNTFDTIRSIALDEDRHDIAEMTEALAALFRYNISRPGEIATLSEEIENSKNYLLIQQYRFPGKFTIEWKIENGNDLERYTLPVLTIQPILENSIHHGIEPMMGNGKIIVRIWETQSKLIIAVEDNGIGIDDHQLNILRSKLNQNFFEDTKKSSGKNKFRGNGIALANVHQRIQLYFGQDYGLEIHSTKDVGTSVYILAPKRFKKT